MKPLTPIAFVKVCVCAFCILLLSGTTYAQNYEIRPYFGTSFYLGDLAPYRHKLSLSDGNLALGLSVGYRVNDLVTIHAKAFHTRISGADENSRSADRRRRNLDFFSKLTDIGISSDFHVNAVIPSLEKFGLDIYINAGLSVFSYNPETIFNGEIVALQPLGTEGQGVPEFNKGQKYSLTQIAIPLGMGFMFDLTDKLAFGLEVIPRITFTDYLDDVSGTYISFEEQSMYQSSLIADIANRTDEFNGVQNDYRTGQMRGNQKNNDWYILGTVFFSYKFGKKEDRKSDKERNGD